MSPEQHRSGRTGGEQNYDRDYGYEPEKIGDDPQAAHAVRAALAPLIGEKIKRVEPSGRHGGVSFAVVVLNADTYVDLAKIRWLMRDAGIRAKLDGLGSTDDGLPRLHVAILAYR